MKIFVLLFLIAIATVLADDDRFTCHYSNTQWGRMWFDCKGKPRYNTCKYGIEIQHANIKYNEIGFSGPHRCLTVTNGSRVNEVYVRYNASNFACDPDSISASLYIGVDSEEGEVYNYYTWCN